MYHDRKDTVGRFPPPPQPFHQHHVGLGQQQQLQLECFSDEVDSGGEAEQRNGRGPSAAGGADAASIEVGKRRRGRPPGSKNKPKPPVVVTLEAEPAAAMRPHVIEIPGGVDVADALARFAFRRGLGICVLAGTGAVANVSLRHRSPDGAAIVFRGRYEILSISATFLPPSMSTAAHHAAAAAAAAGLSISIAGPQGQVLGGAVAGPLLAVTTVVIVAAAFTNPTFHRLPVEDDASAFVSVSGEADEHHTHQPEPQEQHHVSQRPPHAAAVATQPMESCGASIYARHSQLQEAIWSPSAPTARRSPYQ